MIYHCVSSSVSWYIMSLVDTWYIAVSSFFSLLVISCRYHVAFLMIHGHDTDTWYIDDIWWYIAKFKYHTPRRPPYMISNDITWYHPPRPQPKPPDHKLWYHDISCDIMKHDITWYIMIHVHKHTDMSPWYRMIYDDIRWYMEMIWQPGFFAAYCGRHGISDYFFMLRPPRLGSWAEPEEPAASTVWGPLQSMQRLQFSSSWRTFFKISLQYLS